MTKDQTQNIFSLYNLHSDTLVRIKGENGYLQEVWELVEGSEDKEDIDIIFTVNSGKNWTSLTEVEVSDVEILELQYVQVDLSEV